ncbi:RhoGAP-domain-containing protein [Jaminaea rosea]|uniref:RhoGAP-domain-containing protein n=1 Tax=Jaminaea rosea TaxID=1569628 RepID=A0A316UHU0_9BASI|nr:RhoGAP-domain-containing protein [Jaminaea rosea]PWN24474.1 RhoGAP-domain-containing protein [Jaminaea rosea]
MMDASRPLPSSSRTALASTSTLPLGAAPAVLPAYVHHASQPASADIVSSSLLTAFKVSLDEVESYLVGLEARVKCEEDYVRALRTTLDKGRETEAKLDTRVGSVASTLPGASNLPSMRKAWKELQADTRQQIDVRLKFIETLRQSTIIPLRSFFEAQDRIRRRVKEDLKSSLADFEDMRHNHLKRIRKQYEKACETVDTLKGQQQAVEDQRMLLSPPSHSAAAATTSAHSQRSPPSSYEDGAAPPRRSHSKSGRHGRNISATSSPPDESHGFATSPPLDSNGNPRKVTAGALLDALKTKEGWENARKEAAKKTNAFITKMRETGEFGGGGGGGGSSGGSFGGGHERVVSDPNSAGPIDGHIAPSGSSLSHSASLSQSHKHTQFAQSMAIKISKAKREASEADKAYRRVIFDVETLALRREKTLHAARTSVLDCRRELFTLCGEAWLNLVRNAQTMSSAEMSLARHAESVLVSLQQRENLDSELAIVDSRLPYLDATPNSADGPVPYVNYWHGECKSLLFGISLVDYDFARSQRRSPQLPGPTIAEPPLIVSKCVAFIEEHGMDQQGIYRTSAKHTAVQQLVADFERDEARFEFDPKRDEPAAAAGVLKQWLRELPTPVMAMPWEERLKLTHSLEEQLANGFATLKGRIRRLPAIHQVTLRTIIEHLARVAAQAEENKMTARNLSVIFGPVLLSEADRPTPANGDAGGLSSPQPASSSAGQQGQGGAAGMSLAAAMEEDNVCQVLIEYCTDIFGHLERSGAPVVAWQPPGKEVGSSLHVDVLQRSGSGVSRQGSVATSMGRRGSSTGQGQADRAATPDSDRPLVPQGSLVRSNAILAGQTSSPPPSSQALPGASPPLPPSLPRRGSRTLDSNANGNAATLTSAPQHQAAVPDEAGWMGTGMDGKPTSRPTSWSSAMGHQKVQSQASSSLLSSLQPEQQQTPQLGESYLPPPQPLDLPMPREEVERQGRVG